MAEVKDEQVKPRIGRPPATPEQRAASRAVRQAYEKKYRAEHKAQAVANTKRCVEKMLKEQRFKCSLCDRCFPSDAARKYHVVISRAHKTEAEAPAMVEVAA
jgi:hypothetical protein